MVRFLSIAVVGGSAGRVLASSSAWSQQPAAEPPPLQKRATPRDTTKGDPLSTILGTLSERAELARRDSRDAPTPKLASAELAGMAAGAIAAGPDLRAGLHTDTHPRSHAGRSTCFRRSEDV